MNQKVFESEIVRGKNNLLFAIPKEVQDRSFLEEKHFEQNEEESPNPDDLIFIIPDEVVEELNLKENGAVIISLETDGKIILKFESNEDEIPEKDDSQS